MRTARIDLEGRAGTATITRERGSGLIRVEISSYEPIADETPWAAELPITAGADELFKVAEVIQRRCDGHAGTNSMVHDYYRELQRFAA